MQLDLAAIHGREEVLTEVRRKAERQNAESQESGDQLDPVLQTELQQAEIGVANVFEHALEAALEACERIAARLGVIISGAVDALIAQQIVSLRRHQRARQHVGSRKR